MFNKLLNLYLACDFLLQISVKLYFKWSLFLCIYLIKYSVITYVTICNIMYLCCKYIVYFGVTYRSLPGTLVIRNSCCNPLSNRPLSLRKRYTCKKNGRNHNPCCLGKLFHQSSSCLLSLGTCVLFHNKVYVTVVSLHRCYSLVQWNEHIKITCTCWDTTVLTH